MSVMGTYSWNEDSHGSPFVLVEDDTRDALQSVAVTRPTTDERRELLERTSDLGVHLSFLGFPAVSGHESAQCEALVRHVVQRRLSIRPVLMARAIEADLLPILNIQETTGCPVVADLYVSISSIRLRVEGWDLTRLLRGLVGVARHAEKMGLEFRVAFEDSTRATPEALKSAIAAALDVGAPTIVLNDTVGSSNPSGAARHVAFVLGLVARAGSDAAIAWHGHNDKGLALANGIAAVDAGATVVSGTFLGIGERAGNIPLEQLILLLAERGQSGFNLAGLPLVAALFASRTGWSIPSNQPLVGADVFSTGTGTHAAALVKARRLGSTWEDAIYSDVSAAALGREQSILIGPNSGRAAVRAVLDGLSLDSRDDIVERVLQHCELAVTCLRTRPEIEAVVRSAS